MSGTSRLLLPRQVRDLPADLAAVVAVVVLTNLAVFVPVVNETPLRVVFGLAFVLFVPGYAFVAALFPEAGESPVDADEDASDSDGGVLRPPDGSSADDSVADDSADDDATGDSLVEVPTASRSGIDGIERVALSFGLSIAIVPLIGLVLNFTPWGIRLVPIVASLTVFTLGAVAVAAQRRWVLPADERFRVPYRDWYGAARTELLEPDSNADLALNVLLVLSIVLAVGSVTYAVAVPQQGESFTEFYVLTENESGELVADDYPTEFTRGEPQSVVVGVGNQEHETVEYTVLVALQAVEIEGNSTTVRQQRPLEQYSVRLADNETDRRRVSLAPTMTGERLRIKFLLYRGDLPAEPRAENAYRDLHLWVNVSEPGSSIAGNDPGRSDRSPIGAGRLPD